MDVQSMQREVLIKMLHPPGEDTALTWKVLIFDDRCMKVLSSLFHVQQLQKHGVTIMMRIGEKRERIEDTPAVYFIEPTTENIATVARDCKMGLYDSVQLNFCRPLSQKLMQELARQTIQGGIHRKITRVYDQYSDFVSVSSRLVSLGMTNSFAKLTRPVSEKALMNYVDRVVDSLFSIVVTLQQVPIIRCAPGNAAALTAQRLHSKLREHLMSRNNLFSGTGATSYRRPLLILLDRNIDLSVPLHHPWSYCALVNDIFGITSHKVDIPVEEQGSTKMKTYDLTSEDEFWEEYQGAAFPQVAEGVQKYLNEYNERSKELKKDGVDLTDLKSAVNSMPELMRKKRVIDAHTNIATALLKHLKDRQWDRFFELEEELINRVPPSAEDMLKEIQPEAKGTPTDKLRLYLIYSLCHNVKPEDAQAMEKTLQGYASPSADSQYPKLDLSALSFLKTFKMEQKVTSRLTTKTSKVAKESEQRSLFSYLSSTVGARGKKLLQGVRNLIPTDKSLPITKLVESMMENKDSKDTARFLYYDPKLLQTKGPIAGSSRITTSFSEGIVFVMGGGNYVEYQNLQDYAKRASNLQSAVSIAYGSTEIFSGEQFLAQLSSLGKAPTGSDVDDLLD
mmetsp:Transcript_2399/g.4628  ORF Transcript_2399/g.4628 Transcript_2399/m.4628 type:complete len:621 (-) Transcript_2399:146-2008(-)|eukprot:CAMPEP_0167795572 /NCGR_PEP_ID=MMETSP0111_2-20121227/14522_1 /TAXON_ID=91324 /ORGANISM="Lotharella globosa, Strain CCCM811" /LENGTH=620 /DNA_ID=CAMNT_0007689279 /DNA_START=57 /DNA_END=1919 /DNA_ORIENTATION=+